MLHPRLKGLKRLKTLVQACRLPALKPALKRHRLNIPLAHTAASRHPKATHQWLLMGVQACRLPALKPLKRLKGLKRLKTLKMLKTLNGCPSLPFASPETSHEMPSLKHSLGMLHPAASRHPKATHQWLLMGVQACRLPALKPLKRLKGLKRLKTLKMLKTLNGRPSLPFASP